MPPRTFQITFYTRDPARLAKFWSAALGYIAEPPPPGFDSWDEFARENGIPPAEWDALSSLVPPEGKGPRLLFYRVRREKTAKNHVHLDLNVGGGPEQLREEAERLIREGARKIREVDSGREFWIAMSDPDGNEFCLQ